MDEEGMKAISVRQPWAWLIVNGHKDVENRSRRTHYRGLILVHASGTMTRKDWEEAADLAELVGVEVPPFGSDELKRGGIVGEAEIVDCVEDSDSEWFSGKFGFVLEGAVACELEPCKGQLGIFTMEGRNECE